jgi:hypothetical protein
VSSEAIPLWRNNARISRLGAATALIAAALVGTIPGFLQDPFAPFALAICAGLFVFTAFAPGPVALAVVIFSTVPGILGRVQVASLGIKAIAVRPEEVAGLGLMLGHGLRLFRSTREEPVVRRWALFSWVATASFLLSLRLWDPAAMAAGALYIVRWAILGVVLWLAVEESRTSVERQTSALGAILAAATALSVLGFLQLAFFPNMSDLQRTFPEVAASLTDPHVGRLVSTVLDPNLLGVILAPAFVIAVARLVSGPREGRRPALLCAGAILVAMLLTVSRGTLLAAAIGSATVFALVAPRMLWGLVVVVPGLAVVAPRLFQRFQEGLWAPDGVPISLLGFKFQPEPSAYARIESWLAALRIVGEHPLAGVGYNNFGLALLENHEKSAVLYGADSSLLLILGTCGIFGLAVYVWLLGRIVQDAMAAFRRNPGTERWIPVAVLGAFAAMMAGSISTNALIYPPVMICLWTLAGVAAGARGQARA